MNSIEKQAIETFQINLDYFAKEQPNVYKKINILNLAIENGSYTEKYALEYKNDYFDVLEISSNQYLYNQNSIEHANILTQKINYKKSDSVIEGFYNENLTEAQVERYDGKIDVKNILFATAKIMHYANSVTSKDDEMKDIFKFIFCGIGLGLHLQKIEEKVKASQLFIIEDNLELFRLSLFTVNYQELSKKAKLFFSIMDDDLEFKQVFNVFFTQGYSYNHYIKYAMFSQNDIAKIKRIQRAIISSSYFIYPYSMHLKELLKAPEYLVEKYPFIDMSKEYFKISPLSSKPVLLIAAGPSLQKNAQWLQENKDKFIIVAVLASLKTLYKLDIKPDIVTHMHADEISIKLLDGIDKKSYFEDILFILSSVTSRNIIDILPKERVYLFESASKYKQGFRTITSPSIGEVTYAISLILGAKELYLLGLDLALDPATKTSHSKEHTFNRKIQENNPEQDNYTSIKNTIFYTKGNFIEEVPVTSLYEISIEAFNQYSKYLLCHGQKVFNLNNGAFLEGATPQHVEDLDVTKFTTLKKIEKLNNLKTFFDEISENNMSKADIEYMDEQIAEADRLLKLVLEFKQSVSASNYELYIKQFYALYTQLLNFEHTNKYDINKVFSLYLQFIVGYIFDIFNTKQLKNQKRHVKKINEIYIKQLLKILNLYLTTMRVYREWAEK